MQRRLAAHRYVNNLCNMKPNVRLMPWLVKKLMSQYNQITDESNLGGLIDAALQIAGKRREVLHRLRTALVNCDDTEALKFARELCGLENDQANFRGTARFSATHRDGADGKINHAEALTTQGQIWGGRQDE
jgi:hypothetical protein